MLLIPAPHRCAVWARYCCYGRTTHVLVIVKKGRKTETRIRLSTNGRSRDVFDDTMVFSIGRKHTELYNEDSARQRRIVNRLWYCVHAMGVWTAPKPLPTRMGNASRTGPGSYWKDVWLPHSYPAFCAH